MSARYGWGIWRTTRRIKLFLLQRGALIQLSPLACGATTRSLTFNLQPSREAASARSLAGIERGRRALAGS